MLSVCAMRHGLFDSVCAKPTLYFSFCFSLGRSCADAPPSPRPMAATPVASARKVLLSIIFLHEGFAPFSGFFMSCRSSRGCRSSPADVGRLLPQVSVETVLAVLSTKARVLPARVETLNELAAGTVDIEFAEGELPREPHHPAKIVGVDIGRQAVAGIVGEAQRLLEAVDRHDRCDRTEDLALHDRGVVGVDAQNRGLEPMATGKVAFRQAVPARENLGARRDGVVHDLLDLVDLGPVHLGSH